MDTHSTSAAVYSPQAVVLQHNKVRPHGISGYLRAQVPRAQLGPWGAALVSPRSHHPRSHIKCHLGLALTLLAAPCLNHTPALLPPAPPCMALPLASPLRATSPWARPPTSQSSRAARPRSVGGAHGPRSQGACSGFDHTLFFSMSVAQAVVLRPRLALHLPR